MKKIYKGFCKVDNILGKALLGFDAVILFAITMIMCAQVFCRYVLNHSLSWPEEISLYLQVIVVFLTAGYAFGKGQHLCMDVVLQFMPEKIKFIFNKINAVIGMIFSYVLIRYGYKLFNQELSQKLSTIKISKGYVYITIVIGACIMMFYSIMLLIKGREDIK